MAIDRVPPIFAAQLCYLLSHSPFSLKVEQMCSGSKDYPWLDRFSLIIPFCLDFIKWDIIYNLQNPLSAPDVVFGPDDDKFQPFLLSSDGGFGGDPSKSPLYNLSHWNSRDPSRLLSLVLQLREMYSAYQRKRVGEVDDDRVKFEISTILSREVIYPIGRMYQSAPSAPCLKLVSTPELRSLFCVEDVKLPSWLDGMCMAEYIPAVEETLQMQILEAVSHIGIRRHFIEALPAVFGRPLEADPVFGRKATVLAANGAFTFLVHFLIPAQFPEQQPILILQSSQSSFFTFGLRAFWRLGLREHILALNQHTTVLRVGFS